MLVGQQSDDCIDYYEENQGHAEQIQWIFDNRSRHCSHESHPGHNTIGPKSLISELGLDIRNKTSVVENLLHMLRNGFDGYGNPSIFGGQR